jgi:hypothetical protein
MKRILIFFCLFIIYKSQYLFGLGSNDGGQLGLGDINNRKYNSLDTNLTIFNNNFNLVSIGSHTLVYSNKNVFSFGSNSVKNF